jgi:FkbM family methyltransferase
MKINIILKIFLNPLLSIFPTLEKKLKSHLYAVEYENYLNYLLNNKVSLDVIYDIGAHKGRWTKWNRKILKNKKFILFEANEIHKKKLEKIKCDFFIQVLSSEDKKIKFYRKGGTGDSLYQENTEHYGNDYDLVSAKTIDSLVEEKNIPLPNFIKLDVQGAELDILHGAKKTLEHCHLIYIECPVVEYNINAPKLENYLHFMKSINFLPIKIFEQHIHSKILIQIDILFIKKETFIKIIGEKNTPQFLL